MIPTSGGQTRPILESGAPPAEATHAAFWRGKTVLITGGTGSFGKEFTRQLLARYDIRALRIYSRDELKQYEMSRAFQDDRLRFLLGDVRDKERLFRALQGVDVVVHAAALKQVPACEYNPFEAVKTNVLGAANVIDAAIDAGVGRVLAISTDKAANPVNLYGATKLCAEKLFVQGNAYRGARDTRFSCTRYGNVLGSRGSVLPLFLAQRSQGALTITDRRMTRFWITLPDAVSFVMARIVEMRGGEIFVPKMAAARMTDFAAAVAPGCTINEVGIRPGEKLHEILITEDEARHTYDCGSFFIIEPEFEWFSRDGRPSYRPVPDGFRYSSETAAQASLPQLQSLIGSVVGADQLALAQALTPPWTAAAPVPAPSGVS
jgi:UDP-N-acetylglucosamine 4,6-dehydratase